MISFVFADACIYIYVIFIHLFGCVAETNGLILAASAPILHWLIKRAAEQIQFCGGFDTCDLMFGSGRFKRLDSQKCVMMSSVLWVCVFVCVSARVKSGIIRCRSVSLSVCLSAVSIIHRGADKSASAGSRPDQSCSVGLMMVCQQ